jgi:hypothetical protein
MQQRMVNFTVTEHVESVCWPASACFAVARCCCAVSDRRFEFCTQARAVAWLGVSSAPKRRVDSGSSQGPVSGEEQGEGEAQRGVWRQRSISAQLGGSSLSDGLPITAHPYAHPVVTPTGTATFEAPDKFRPRPKSPHQPPTLPRRSSESMTAFSSPGPCPASCAGMLAVPAPPVPTLCERARARGTVTARVPERASSHGALGSGPEGAGPSWR